MTKPLAGKIALVTGASSGIGAATALSLAEAGAKVAVCARRVERLEGLVGKVGEMGGEALAIPGDMTVESDARSAVEKTIERFGALDILVNSAGVMQAGGIEGCDTALYKQVIDINLMGTVYTCAAAVPHMVERGTGDIITISSLAGRKGGPMTSAYSASKHAVNMMTDGMRQELGGKGIRVVTLMPGATETEVGENIADPNWRKAITAHVTKEGAVKPRDIGEAIVFICAMPRRTNISEISIRPTIDTSA
jgi:NADP-dependent 3-hydroxy acid dehydrogenase YdfG